MPKFVSKMNGRVTHVAVQAKPARAALVAQSAQQQAEVPKVEGRKRAIKISPELLARMRNIRKGNRPQTQENPFRLPKLLPGIVPENTEQLAHDNALEETGFNAAFSSNA